MECLFIKGQIFYYIHLDRSMIAYFDMSEKGSRVKLKALVNKVRNCVLYLEMQDFYFIWRILVSERERLFGY